MLADKHPADLPPYYKLVEYDHLNMLFNDMVLAAMFWIDLSLGVLEGLRGNTVWAAALLFAAITISLFFEWVREQEYRLQQMRL